jgi:hypothetical protein
VRGPPDDADRGLLGLVATLLDPGGAGGGAGGAASGAADGDRAPATAGATLDPARVRRHLLAPLAHRAGFPGFRSDYIAAALHAERRAGFLAEVLGAFGDLPVLRLKGIAYIATLYDDPAERPMTDIDLLVPGPRFAEAAGRLRALGYVDDGKRNQRSAANHAVTFRRRESAIDLHRSMVQRGRMALDLDAVWWNATPLPDGSLVADPTSQYLIHLAHMARQEFAVPLIAFADAARLVARLSGPPPAGAWGLARAHRLLEAYLEALGRARLLELAVFPGVLELLRGELPPRWLQILRKVAIHDRPRDLLGLAGASLRTRLGV